MIAPIFTHRMDTSVRILQASPEAWNALLRAQRLDYAVSAMISAAIPPDATPGRAIRIGFERSIGDRIVRVAMEED